VRIEGADSGAVGFSTTDPGLTLSETLACFDGLDNDGDGFVDEADPGCDDAADPSELGVAACDDGIDNDGDGSIDTADPDCLGNPSLDQGEETGRFGCGLAGELVLLLPLLRAIARRRRGAGPGPDPRRSPGPRSAATDHWVLIARDPPGSSDWSDRRRRDLWTSANPDARGPAGPSKHDTSRCLATTSSPGGR
jgi:hypothetical protein